MNGAPRVAERGHAWSALVVEDNAALRLTLCSVLAQLLDGPVRGADGLSSCTAVLHTFHPDLVVLDVELGDGDAFDALTLLSQLPVAPRVVVVSGVAGPDEAFRLAQLGVRRYVQKPINLDSLEETIRSTLQEPPDLTPHLRVSVGIVPLQHLEEQVRQTMLEEALARSGGNRRGAARLLQVSRQLLQHMLRKLPNPS